MNFLKQLLSTSVPSDIFSKKYPVSIKGIVSVNGKIVLLKNERQEWELPGGKIELNETAEQCIVREIKEELNIDVVIDKLIDVWMYNILNKVDVCIITYLCKPLSIDVQYLKISNEHKEMGLFAPEEIAALNMPEGYKTSISKALKIID
ncbi:MAG TPA: NUDIX hydrolase [Bacteroidia bacterium]|nr:NUDIX hydrolase [Bacteroidia bacterium]